MHLGDQQRLHGCLAAFAVAMLGKVKRDKNAQPNISCAEIDKLKNGTAMAHCVYELLDRAQAELQEQKLSVET